MRKTRRSNISACTFLIMSNVMHHRHNIRFVSFFFLSSHVMRNMTYYIEFLQTSNYCEHYIFLSFKFLKNNKLGKILLSNESTQRPQCVAQLCRQIYANKIICRIFFLVLMCAIIFSIICFKFEKKYINRFIFIYSFKYSSIHVNPPV